jgi:hypothetical protein
LAGKIVPFHRLHACIGLTKKDGEVDDAEIGNNALESAKQTPRQPAMINPNGGKLKFNAKHM